MRRNLVFLKLAAFSVRRPWLVLGLAVVLSAISLLGAALFLNLRTSNLDLIDQDLPPIHNFLEFSREFGTPNVLVIVLEGDQPAAMEQAVDQLVPALRQVSGVRSVMGKIPLAEEKLEQAGINPYLTSRDRSLYLIYVQPGDPRSQAETIAPLLDSVRDVLKAADLDRQHVRTGLTGIPQYAIDDRDVIQNDISRLSFISFLFVGVLFMAAFAALRRPLMSMVTLGFSVVITLGAITIFPGHLTLLSAFFASILFGLGIDYGIHIINRIEEYMSNGISESDAITKSISSLAPELTTGAITTAVAFFSMLTTNFQGFRELGIIAGGSILICLLLMATVLPALLTLVPHRQNRVITPRDSRVGRMLMALQHPVLIWGVGIASMALSLMGDPGFDGNYMNLQPVDSEAVRLERAMVEKSNLSPQFAVFTVDTKTRAVDLADRLLDEATVGDVRSIADLEMLAPVDGEKSEWPADFVRGFVSDSGRYAVYAYPVGNVWNPVEQDAFVTAMQSYDPRVTGMPILGQFMTDQSNRALRRTATMGGLLLCLCVWLNFRRIAPTILAVTPTFLTVASVHGIMKLMDMPFNPINIMALPVILGIAVDDGIHMVHRFISEKGDIARTLAGSGRSVVLTSLTTLAAFGSLAFTRHQGLASFAVVLCIGITMALVVSVLLLPGLLKLVGKKLLKSATTSP